MSEKRLATLEETALGAFLHDIGKFLQRARVCSTGEPAALRQWESELLPSSRGRYTHRHVLWTWAFFEWIEQEKLELPGGLEVKQVREAACFHHRPLQQNPITVLVQVADQLASGMERKPKDEEAEAEAASMGWDTFVRTPLRSVFSDLLLERGCAKASYVPLEELRPGEQIEAREKLDAAQYPARYARLWERFEKEFKQSCSLPNGELFLESVLSLSERFTFAVPSSTVDQPDIPLHDHHRAVAALAAALYQWHKADETLEDVPRIRNLKVPKFRFIVGDLSGIQAALFRLAAQRVRGVNKILRARSFLMSMLIEGAALHVRLELKLPVFSVLQAAGGRFLILAPAIRDLESVLEMACREIEGWMMERYLGELALNVAVTEAFGGEQLSLENFPQVQASMRRAVEEAKLRPLYRAYRSVHHLAYPRGACSACGIRPGAHEEARLVRCTACDEEARLGGDLPKAEAIYWVRGGRGNIAFFGELSLGWQRSGEFVERSNWISGFRLGPAAGSGLPLRFLGNYVPVWTGERREFYRRLMGEEGLAEAEPGGVKLFEMLAADAVEEVEGELKGEAMLAVLKADVDRLGEHFRRGLKAPSLARYAALSRMLDFFFSGQLQWLLRTSYPETYTVYSGGDDLLLIGPWKQILQLARDLRRRFGSWTGQNEDVTLSAAVEFMKPWHPLNRVVRAAEDRLDKAKRAEGKDRICLIDREPVTWEVYDLVLRQAWELSNFLRKNVLSTALLHRLLALDMMRSRVENDGKADLSAAAWRARLRYLRARHIEGRADVPEAMKRRILEVVDATFGFPGGKATVRLAGTIALYGNRSPEERS